MARTLKDVLDESNPGKLASAMQVARAGSLLATSSQYRALTIVTHIGVLPNYAKAAQLLTVFATAGTTAGAKAVVAGTPATGQVAINPAGDVLFAAVDAVTAAEVTYVPERGPVISETVPVVSNVATPLQGRKVRNLISSTATVGTSTGAKTTVARGTTPTAGQAAINTLGTGVAFAAADAVTQATITYVATPGIGATPVDPVSNLVDASQSI
jgi:hypothetical protein